MGSDGAKPGRRTVLVLLLLAGTAWVAWGSLRAGRLNFTGYSVKDEAAVLAVREQVGPGGNVDRIPLETQVRFRRVSGWSEHDVKTLAVVVAIAQFSYEAMERLKARTGKWTEREHSEYLRVDAEIRKLDLVARLLRDGEFDRAKELLSGR